VVSIHIVPPNTPPTMRDLDFTPIKPGGQYIDSRTPLSWMIAFAYKVSGYQQLVGLPKWADTQSYAVSAKPAGGFPELPPNENLEQVRLMMRAMLADRFHLQLHTETRQESIFNLEVGRGGFKLKEVEPPVPPAKEGYVGGAMGDDSGRLIGTKSTMVGLARALNVFLRRPVVDRTGLTGYYDFDVKWRSAEPRDESQCGADCLGMLISNLQDQFGLRLVKTTGPVPYWVVDHVEPPTAN
jgi:uncharacterized protein (TIGR03435 family)